jgi:hypothetical protein
MVHLVGFIIRLFSTVKLKILKTKYTNLGTYFAETDFSLADVKNNMYPRWVIDYFKTTPYDVNVTGYEQFLEDLLSLEVLKNGVIWSRSICYEGS